MGAGLDIAYAAAALATCPFWGVKMLRTGKWRTDWPARFGRVTPPTPPNRAGAVSDGPLPADARPRTLLLHAVSVGEVNAIRLLVRQLHAQAGPNLRIVISATTDTGIARARSLFEPTHTVVRFPFDFSFAVRRFLDAVRPDAVALVELELWPNFTAACARRQIPLVVINGRLSDRSFTGYQRFRPFVRPMFARLRAAAVQTPDYARRFAALGTPANQVCVLDTMKWDTAEIADPDQVPGAAALAAALGLDRTRPIIVAGSTGPGEEKFLLDSFAALPAALDLQLVLVPRKPERFEEVAALIPGGPGGPGIPGVIRRTQHPDGSPPPSTDGGEHARRIFLLDTMGELRKAYALADVCLVGRSFLGLYGSDMMEPIALGKPTIIGPYYGDFAEIMRAFEDAEGILVTDQPAAAVAQLLSDPRRTAARRLADNGRRVILSRQGATARHASLLLQVLGLVGVAAT
jgi:3-deoxy-D-manno-octulosonic-acid transferase